MRKTSLAVSCLLLLAATVLAPPARGQGASPCATGAPFTSRAGIADELAGSSEPTARGAALAAAFPQGRFKDFDSRTANSYVGQTFEGLPAGIVRAELAVRVRPHFDLPGNDTLYLGLLPGARFAFSARLADLTQAGDRWRPGAPATTVTLDLGRASQALLAQVAAERALDVLVQDDSAVDFMTLRVWTCPPPTPFGGLPHRALGNAQLARDAQGGLVVSNLGTGGTDGVRIELGQSEGWGFAIDALDPATAPPGAFRQWAMRGVVDGVADQHAWTERHEVAVTGQEKAVRVLLDSSPLGATRNEVYVYDGPRLVFHGAFPNGELYRFISTEPVPPPLSLRAQWDATCVVIVKNDPLRWNVKMADGRVISQYDRIETYAENPTSSFGARTAVESTASGTSQVTISEEVLVLHGQPFRAVGEATLEAAGDHLTVSNLGTAGDRGALIDFGRAQEAGVDLAPLDPRGTAPAGAFLEAEAIGAAGGTAGRGLAKIRAVKGNSSGIPQLAVAADFSSLGEAGQRIEVWNEGIRVAEVTAPAGAEVRAQSLNVIVIWPIAVAADSEPGGSAGFALTWAGDVAFDLPGGTEATGDELRIRAEGSALTAIDNLSGLALRAARLTEITVLDVAAADSCAPVITTVRPGASTCAAGRPLSFSVAAEGDGALTYQWLRNGAPLTDSGRISGSQTSTLDLAPTNVADAGSYQVVVRNSCGAVTSGPAAYQPAVSLRGLVRRLAGDVANLVAAGRLSRARGTELQIPLFQALSSAGAGDVPAARSRLDAFSARVDALAAAGVLRPDEAARLKTAARTLRGHLDC